MKILINLLKLTLIFKFGSAKQGDPEQNLDDFDDGLNFDDRIDRLLEKLKRSLNENDKNEVNCDDCDTNNDELDKWNGLDNNPDYVHPEFHNFLPTYYKVSIKYHLSGEKISGSGKTMYDTGANINVMNKEEFDRINRITPLIIDSVSKKPSITQGDGTKMRGYLGTTFIWITLEDSFGNISKIVKMKFYVFKSIGDIDVIIGRHFMKKASIESVTEFPKVYSIKFGGFENVNSDLRNGIWFCLIIVVLMIVMRKPNRERVNDKLNFVPPSEKNRSDVNVRRRKAIVTLGDVYADDYERRTKK